MATPLQGKNAIVTGGSRGLGKAIAIELGKRGANVLITYNSASQKADEIVQVLQTSYDIEAFSVQASGTDPAAPRKIVKAACAQWDKIDIIINNAGAGDDIAIKDLTIEIWSKILDTNLRFPCFLIKEAIPHFGPAPRIVNISSVMGRMGGTLSGPYTASKAGLEGVTKVLAQELGRKHNATFNCINPGPIDTDMWTADAHPDVIQEWEYKVSQTPAGARIAQPDDIAQIVAFLCDESSRWVSGSTVCANGGMCFT